MKRIHNNDVTAKIRTQHLPETSLEPLPLSQPARKIVTVLRELSVGVCVPRTGTQHRLVHIFTTRTWKSIGNINYRYIVNIRNNGNIYSKMFIFLNNIPSPFLLYVYKKQSYSRA
jgi:hypothetical protein